MDIYWRDHLQCPTEEEYKQMISESLELFLGFTNRDWWFTSVIDWIDASIQ